MGDRSKALLQRIEELQRGERAPSFEEARRRLGPESVPDADGLVGGAQVFGSRTYRQETGSGALQLTRTERGLRAWDPDARFLAVWWRPEGGPLRLLATEQTQEPGVGLELDVALQGGALVSAAALEPFDPMLFACALLDLASRGIAVSDWARGAQRVHVGELVLRSAPAPRRLTLRTEPLPVTAPAVQALLSEARGRGQAGGYQAACSGYARALGLAHTLGDDTGLLKARMGLSLGLDVCGYNEDAGRLLDELARVPLDPPRAAWLACRMGWHRLYRGGSEAAEAWAAEATALGDRTTSLTSLRAAIAMDGGDHGRALSLLDALPTEGLNEDARLLVDARRRVCLTGLGRLGEAGALRPKTLSSVPDVAAWQVLAQAVSERRSSRVRWRVAVERLREVWEGVRRVPNDAADVLVSLARMAHEDGDPSTADALLRLRFLVPLGTGTVLLAASQGGHLVRSAAGAVEAIPLAWADARKAVLATREEWQAGDLGSATLALRVLLGIDRLPREGCVAVGVDAALTGAPWLGLIDGRPVRVLVRSGTPRGRPSSARVASFADTRGDLPEARSELACEADVRCHGPAATWRELSALGEVGLLHIAVHTRRELGLPALDFADRLVVPSDIAGLQLRGAPLVILSGCGAADQSGLERSFASAFLEAGASSVVATAWPVADHEAAEFVRRLSGIWQEAEPSDAVARVVRSLRDADFPSRVWSAPIVY